jgi:uncharacterized NAD(P)/FAD-binding protein YdhS
MQFVLQFVSRKAAVRSGSYTTSYNAGRPSTIMANKNIAIIGGGASAALLVSALSRHLNGNEFRIDIYDRAGAFARGIAYSTNQIEHLLNVRAGNMSAYADDSAHFLTWLDGKYGALDFVPRKIYGDYLSDQIDAASKNLSLNFIQEDVLSCTPVSIETANGHKSYDYVIQATGNCVALSCKAEQGIQLYYSSPWNIDYNTLASCKKIVLIGSGLSAIDFILSLNAHNYRGQICVVSRNGLFPGVHADPFSYPPFLEEAPSTVRKTLQRVRKEIRKAQQENIPWQAVIDSMRGMTNQIWHGWDARQKQLFQSRLFTFWNVHRHRRAPLTQNILTSLRNEGRLENQRAKVMEIVNGPIVLTDKGAIDCDVVINCLGYRYAEAGRDYQPYAALGPAGFGPLLETTAIPEIRAQAYELAVKIISENK